MLERLLENKHFVNQKLSVQELRLKHFQQTKRLLKVCPFKQKKYVIIRCSESYCIFSVLYMIVFSQENNAGRTVFT
jgi:hypothetical protein